MKARFISEDVTETPTEFLGYHFPVNIWVGIKDDDAGKLSSMPCFEVAKGNAPTSEAEPDATEAPAEGA